MSANYPGTNPAEEGQPNDNQPHVSYVKHLSSDENAPGVGDSSGGGGIFGWVQKVPGGWWTVGIGVATLVILFMTMRAMSGASTVPSTTPSGSNGSTDTTSGLSQDTYGQNPSAMDSQLSGLLSQEQINWNLLQQILNKPPTTPAPTPTPVGVNPGPPPRPFRLPLPAPKGTNGMSNNFWVYTTSGNDTLQSILNKANWGQHGTSYLWNYRNNASIFNWYGVDPSKANQKLPAGIKISL